MMVTRKEAAMLKLEQAEAALAAANDAAEAARVASMDATADAATLRASVKAGNGSKVTPADISEADALADHAALAFQGAAAVLPALGAAVLAARADEAADEVIEALPQLGRDIAVAPSGLEEALVPVVAACRHYDAYVETATSHLQTVVGTVPEPSQTVRPPTQGGTAESPFTGTGSEPATVAERSPQPVRAALRSRGTPIRGSTTST